MVVAATLSSGAVPSAPTTGVVELLPQPARMKNVEITRETNANVFSIFEG